MDIGKEVVRLIDRLESEKKSGDEIIGIIREKIENPEELKQENDMKELTLLTLLVSLKELLEDNKTDKALGLINELIAEIKQT
ncbi:MAG: hypothetical protein J5992_02650 [Oscillospiraceae bacterium]|nr:hypothetical protein [Oscillospiraceae bacterium]